MGTVKWRYAKDGLELKVSEETGLFIDSSNPEENRTIQDAEPDTNINEILRRYGVTNDRMPTASELAKLPMSDQLARYGDFTGETDFQFQQNALIEARDAFMALPARVRKEFDNDPAKLLEFVHNPDNREKAKELGLLAEPRPEPEPIRVRVEPNPSEGGDVAS